MMSILYFTDPEIPTTVAEADELALYQRAADGEFASACTVSVKTDWSEHGSNVVDDCLEYAAMVRAQPPNWWSSFFGTWPS
jgi:hypothetical protein